MKPERDPFVTVQVPPELYDRLERFREQLGQRNPGIRYTRSDVLRSLVIVGLDLAEQAGSTVE